MTRVFVTGATGFVGGPLVEDLIRRGHTVSALVREGRSLGSPTGQVSHVPGDLLDPETYAAQLSEADVVVHLAAATGKAAPRDHFRVNLEGTRLLVRECARVGVRKFLFASSIAVKFPDKTRYYYAQSKEQAEAVVRQSGLDFVIIRPTIIVGRGSPVLEGLRRLAELPVTPIFGAGRARVQPIYLADLVRLIAVLIDEDSFDSATLELGGPETVTIEEFLGEISLRAKGSNARSLHLPLGLVLPVLAALEAVIYRLLPVTTGQLASFRYDGIVSESSFFDGHRTSLLGIESMLERSL